MQDKLLNEFNNEYGLCLKENNQDISKNLLKPRYTNFNKDFKK